MTTNPYSLSSEIRSDVTYLDEKTWESTVTKLMDALEAGAKKHWDAPPVKRPKNPKWANGSKMERIREILAENPRATTRDICRIVGCGEHLVSRVRASMGIVWTNTGTQTVARLKALLEENPEISHAEAGRRLKVSPSYVGQLRRTILEAK